MILCRFTHDLRLDDHAALAAAAERGPVLPVLVLDESLLASLRRSPLRAGFFAGAAAALDASLRERGSALVIRRGEAAASLLDLARSSGASGVVWSARYDGAGSRADLQLRASLEEAGLGAHCVDDAPAIAPGAIERDGKGYRAFAPYFDRWRETPVPSYDVPLLLQFAHHPNVESEPLPSPEELGATGVAADSTPLVAAERLQAFLANGVRAYASARRDPSEDGTSRLSAHLSWGTLSLRTAVRGAREALDNPFLLNEERRSVRSFLRSLAMRDFFFALAYFNPETDRAPLQERMRDFAFTAEHPLLGAWCSGRTGFPLVDAGMRQLAATGWMHPYVRAVSASFLCFDLGVDWHVGRDVWDTMSIEDDAAVATGNWQWIAGVGADLVQYPRIYNPLRGQRRVDPDGTYARAWVHELRHRPLGPSENLAPMLPLYDGNPYPSPAVDHAAAARTFLERYRAHLLTKSASVQGSEAPGG